MSEAVVEIALANLRGRRRPFTPALPSAVGHVPGIYAFWVGEECLYVGMSTQLGQRLYQHRVQEHNRRLERYLKAYWKYVEVSVAPNPGRTAACLKEIEQRVINILRPRTNIAIRRAS